MEGSFLKGVLQLMAKVLVFRKRKRLSETSRILYIVVSVSLFHFWKKTNITFRKCIQFPSSSKYYNFHKNLPNTIKLPLRKIRKFSFASKYLKYRLYNFPDKSIYELVIKILTRYTNNKSIWRCSCTIVASLSKYNIRYTASMCRYVEKATVEKCCGCSYCFFDVNKVER